MLSAEPVFSIVLSTYNRGDLLVDAVRSLLALDPASPPHELIIVDNNSTDHTRDVVEALVPESGGRLRYVFEGRQGLPHARNAGIAASRGRIVVFTDDDVRAQADLLIAYDAAFTAYPEVAWMGGKVLPMWPSPPPAWLTDAHWAPLAITDFGETGIGVTREQFRCLVGANLAMRREVFEVIGGFDPAFRHERGAVTACEDHEFEVRLVNAGLVGRYEPSAVIHAEVQPNRLTKAYHRKWWYDHGRAKVRMTPPKHTFIDGAEYVPQPTWARHVVGTPLYLFREAAALSVGGLKKHARGDRPSGFWFECQVRMRAGMISYHAEMRHAGDNARNVMGLAARPTPWAGDDGRVDPETDAFGPYSGRTADDHAPADSSAATVA